MHRRAALFGLLVGLVLPLGAAASSAKIPRWEGSWADSRHIWVGGDDSYLAACDSPGWLACGTEDGGESWHPIFRYSNSRFGQATVLRTSPAAGFLSLHDGPTTRDWKHFWTIDAGRHWYRTRLFDKKRAELAGHDRYVYRRYDDWTALERVLPWPRSRAPGCPSGWIYDLGRPDAPPDEWGAICTQPAARHGFRLVPYRAPGDQYFNDVATVPHGVVSVLTPVRHRRPRVILLRKGRPRFLRLPKGRAPRGTRNMKTFQIYAEWPYIAVTAPAWGTPVDGHPALLACVFWETRNGGRTWRSRRVSVDVGWDTKRFCEF